MFTHAHEIWGVMNGRRARCGKNHAHMYGRCVPKCAQQDRRMVLYDCRFEDGARKSKRPQRRSNVFVAFAVPAVSGLLIISV